MKNIVIISILMIAFLITNTSCNQSPKVKNEKKEKVTNNEVANYRAEKVWSTEQKFDVPESVCYDAARDVLYVANISGKPSEKDGKGFISKLNTKGKIVELNWVEGIDAPKGMGVHKDKLYVTNVDEFVVIDIAQGKELARYPCEGATFANDIAIDESGVVYITDMQGGSIYMFDGEKVSMFIDQGTFNRPNGLFACKDYLFVGVADRIYQIDYKTSDTVTYIKNTDPVDGLEKVAEGAFLKSDWQGRVHLVQPGKDKIELTNTVEQKVNAADIEYIPTQKLMLVPTFFDNRVVAYKISE
jgi:sugar lactone lactonase YvrE